MRNELYHHGILGQRWGIRRFQNAVGSLTDAVGSLTDAGKKKEYKKSLKNDKRFRRTLENKSYDSARFANLYSKKYESYSKKYEKAVLKDPNKLSDKTKRIEKTKNVLDYKSNAWNAHNAQNVKSLKKHVNKMIDKYSDVKIKDISSKTNKRGIEYVNSITAFIYNNNAVYNLRKNYRDGYYDYTPVKTRYYGYYMYNKSHNLE